MLTDFHNFSPLERELNVKQKRPHAMFL